MTPNATEPAATSGSTPHSRSRPAVRAGSRDRLLDAAEQVLVAHGATALTLEATAAAAGVSKGGLLYHFPSKDRLLEGLVERAVGRVDAALAAAAAEGTPGAFTRAYLDVTIPAEPAEAAAGLGDGERLAVALVATAALNPRLLAPLREAYARWQRRLEDDGIDPATATVVRLAVDGWWMAAVLDLPRVSADVHRGVRGFLEAATR